ncbi:MAG: bifunctional DNA primase/polymerase [Streptosporangiaceae bacterium]
MSTRDAAVAAAAEGWAVFPGRPRDKRPAVPDHPERDCGGIGRCRNGHLGWEQLACADPERVGRYWPSGQHNIGGACKRQFVVIDLDSHHHGDLPPDWASIPGVTDGRDVLAILCEWAGQPWPTTRTIRTPLDGWHLVFVAPADRVIRNSASNAADRRPRIGRFRAGSRFRAGRARLFG